MWEEIFSKFWDIMFSDVSMVWGKSILTSEGGFTMKKWAVLCWYENNSVNGTVEKNGKEAIKRADWMMRTLYPEEVLISTDSKYVNMVESGKNIEDYEE
jgi:hypothetical protein